MQQGFYTVVKQERQTTAEIFTVEIDSSHPVFDGHFPTRKIVPGVMLIYIIKDLFETITKKKLKLTGANTIKFLQVINPDVGKLLRIKIESTPNPLQINCQIFLNEKICFKMDGTFESIER